MFYIRTHLERQSRFCQNYWHFFFLKGLNQKLFIGIGQAMNLLHALEFWFRRNTRVFSNMDCFRVRNSCFSKKTDRFVLSRAQLKIFNWCGNMRLKIIVFVPRIGIVMASYARNLCNMESFAFWLSFLFARLLTNSFFNISM